jgi:hypothetical protein
MTTLDERHAAEAHLRDRYVCAVADSDSPVVVFSQFAAEVFTEGVGDLEAGDALAALRLVTHVRDIISNDERLAISAARELGLTWKQIAEALDLDSPQAAAQRLNRLGGAEKFPTHA